MSKRDTTPQTHEKGSLSTPSHKITRSQLTIDNTQAFQGKVIALNLMTQNLVALARHHFKLPHSVTFRLQDKGGQGIVLKFENARSADCPQAARQIAYATKTLRRFLLYVNDVADENTYVFPEQSSIETKNKKTFYDLLDRLISDDTFSLQPLENLHLAPTDKKQGFLPGELKEKYAKTCAPYRDKTEDSTYLHYAPERVAWSVAEYKAHVIYKNLFYKLPHSLEHILKTIEQEDGVTHKPYKERYQHYYPGYH